MRRILFPVAIVIATAAVMIATVRDARQAAAAAAVTRVEPVGGTSRAELTRTVDEMTGRIAARPDDGAAVVRLADALIRLQRINNDGRAVITAEQQLRTFLKGSPKHYEAGRMLAAVLLSQHRFGEAIAQANKLRARDPRDAWNYGAIGDGSLELGDYESAFAAFDRMGQLQPGPPAYARTAYGLELKGDLRGALEYMRRAADGISPNDPESQAWHFAQVGALLLQLGQTVEAKREFEHAAVTFPNHPHAMVGLARVKVVDGDIEGARLMLQEQLARVPTPDLAADVGDLLLAAGDASSAEQYFQMSEQIERAAWGNGPEQPQELARFLVNHDRRLDEAVALAERAAVTRRDIFTMDTLAWCYFKAGRLQDASRAMSQARRTGSVDARLLYHAAEIQLASGNAAGAREVLAMLPSTDASGDAALAAALKRLRAQLAS
jgi:tetratricopeptide (TPR) repeat protein